MTDLPRERVHLVITGHVDHGKSTLVGRLLADTGSLPVGKLEAVRELCARTSKPFEYAFLLDALKDERAQGITIDTARVFFRTGDRDYLILDAPGHIEFVKNMVTGAARADAALLCIDAHEGVQENSRRHGHLLGLLGIRQVGVILNKMDLVGFDEAVYRDTAELFTRFLERVGIRATASVPVSAREGDNVAGRSAAMPWYRGPTVLELLAGFEAARPVEGLPFRMPVQDVYKFTAQGDDRRIVAGTIDSGSLSAGDTVVFYPSGKRSRVRGFEAFAAPPPTSARAGAAVGFTLAEQVYVARGELAARADEPPPKVATRFRTSLFWLGTRPLVAGNDYLLKLGSARVRAELESVRAVYDAASLDEVTGRERVERHEVAECILRLDRPLAFDPADLIQPTGRFVLVDDFEIRGGGIIREALPDEQSRIREQVLRRNVHWEPASVSSEQRAARYGQRPMALLITGESQFDRKGLARALEERLFLEGRAVYFLGIGNVLYGVDADLDRRQHREEHLRRLAEVTHILTEAGLLVILTASDLAASEAELMRTIIGHERFLTAWIGEPAGTDLEADLALSPGEEADTSLARFQALLEERGAVFRP
jgi:bifunctional enzyme CysN/CysC